MVLPVCRYHGVEWIVGGIGEAPRREEIGRRSDGDENNRLRSFREDARVEEALEASRALRSDARPKNSVGVKASRCAGCPWPSSIAAHVK